MHLSLSISLSFSLSLSALHDSNPCTVHRWFTLTILSFAMHVFKQRFHDDMKFKHSDNCEHVNTLNCHYHLRSLRQTVHCVDIVAMNFYKSWQYEYGVTFSHSDLLSLWYFHHFNFNLQNPCIAIFTAWTCVECKTCL